MFSLDLSLKGDDLRLMSSLYGEDFTFIVNGESIKCNKFIASAFFHSVFVAVQLDPLTNTMELDSLCDPLIMRKVINAIKGESVKFEENEILDLCKLSSVLDSPKIMDYATKEIVSQLKPETTFKIVSFLIESGINYKNMLSYIAENFSQIAKYGFSKMSKNFYLEVFNDKKFKYDPVAFAAFLDFYLSDCADEDDNLIEEIPFDDIDLAKALGHCTTSKAKAALNIKCSGIVSRILSSFSKFEKVKTINPGFSGSTNGIFTYLTDLTGGNIVDNGTISIFVESGHELVHDLIDFKDGQKRHYKNNNTKQSNYITFDFRNMMAKITHYTIVSCYCTDFGCEPRDWEIYTSNDGIEWELVDEVENNDTLLGKYTANTFEITSPRYAKFFQFVQLENHTARGVPIMHLSGFEVFGSIKGVDFEQLAYQSMQKYH